MSVYMCIIVVFIITITTIIIYQEIEYSSKPSLLHSYKAKHRVIYTDTVNVSVCQNSHLRKKSQHSK